MGIETHCSAGVSLHPVSGVIEATLTVQILHGNCGRVTSVENKTKEFMCD